MKKHLMLMLVSLAALTLAAGCNKEQAPQTAEQKPAAQPAAPGAPAAQAGKSGKVVETMNAGGYTYVQVEEKGQKLWVAVMETKLKVGDTVEFHDSQPMVNFQSKSLNRTFDKIIFAPGIKVEGAK